MKKYEEANKAESVVHQSQHAEEKRNVANQTMTKRKKGYAEHWASQIYHSHG